MADYILSCCSTSDLSNEFFAKKDIQYCCFHFNVDGVDYPDDLGKSYPLDKFYTDMEKGAMTKTSQLSTGEYFEYFEKFAKEGKNILHCTLSSGISGTYNSAVTAADMIKEKYPNIKIYIVDSLCASSGFGLLMSRLAEKRDEGMSIEEVRNYAEEHKLEAHHWFFSTDLKYYVRGGRVSKVSGFVGTMLKICPLLNVDEQGKLIPREKIRTVKKVEEALVQKMETYCNNSHDYDEEVFISHSFCPDYANAVKDMVEAKFPKVKVQVFPIGTTIGSHTGPGTVALFFWGKKRTN